MARYYLFFGILLLSLNAHSQQCTVNRTIDIPDDGKSYNVKLEANTTQSGNRVLCGVRLAFKHQFADELRFVLVSPGGKSITLIAGKSASSKTSESSWNVLFVRQDDTPHPDDFKKPVWNENKWSEDQEYVGSYFPDDDKGLDYFDGERETGTWNLIYSDKVNGGTGVLQRFELIFCDPPLFCSPCQISRDFMNNQNFGSFCGGDPSLVNIQPSINQSHIKSGFDYSFIVLNGKKRVVAKGRNPDLSQLSVGSYEIIGIQFRPENSSLLSDIKDRDDLSDLFYRNQSKICGSISNASSEFTILSNPGIREEVLNVYGRNYITIDGQYISSDQTVVQSFIDQNGCDSLIHTKVNFKVYNPEFTQDNIYDCENTSVRLSVSSEPEFPVHRWFTSDGKINNQSDIKSSQITVEAPGTYFVVFEIKDYLDTIAYQLNIDPNSPVITLSNEYALCSSSPLLLSIGSNFDEASVKPSSTASINGNNLTIREPDLYTITVRKGSCELIKHILIQPSETGETVQIGGANLSCPENPVELSPSLTDEYENYSWSYQGKEIADSKTLSTNKPGFYAFRAFDGDQCGISGTAWVEDNIPKVDLQIEGPSLINCSNENKDNRLTASFLGDFDSHWTLPDGSTINDKDIPVNQDGLYSVQITDKTGCTYTASQNISTVKKTIDFEVPEEITIPCNSTSASITANVMASSDEYRIKWSGASGGNPANIATVKSPGIVQVSVTHNISQCTQTKSIRVRNEPGKPEVTFDAGLDRTITCSTPSRRIPLVFNNCNNCMPVLTTKSDIRLEANELIARDPGTVDIKLDNGACVSSHTVTFPDQTKAKNIKIVKDDIGCNGKQGHIEITNSNDYDLIELQTPQDTFPYSGILSNITSPVSYKVIYTDKENGCTGQENINITATSMPPSVDYEPLHYLNCSTGKAALSVKGDDITRIVWFDPEGNEIGQKTRELEVNKPGKYRFVVYNKNDCYQDLTIEVKDDRSTPSINLEPVYLLPCDASITGITPSYDTTTLDSVVWYGQGGWSSTKFFPTLDVGDYRVFLVGKNGCKTTEKTTVNRQSAGTAPTVIAPPINCRSPYSRVHLKEYKDVDEIQWIDESGQASLNDTFDVYNPGKISLTIQMKNGCLLSSSLSVKEDKATVPFKINKPVINCHNLQPQFQVETSDTVNRPIFYQWYFGDSPVGRDATYDIEYPGDYRVEVSYDNGCIDSLSHTVKLDTTSVPFRLRTDTISCARSKIQLRNEVDSDQISKATWTGPSDFTSTAIRPNFQMPGTYEVIYVGENGCEGKSEMKIFGDLVPPEPDSVDYLSLGCGDKMVDLTYFTNDSVTTQYWQLPDGQILEDSIIKINAKGDYTLFLEGENGCSRIDTFTIDRTVNPKFDIKVQDAGCDDQTGSALLLPEKDTFEAIWYDPSTMDEISRGFQTPEIASGSYLVTVINPYNNCDTTTTFEIKDISRLLEAEISIDDSLRCERSQANLISSIYPPSENYRYEWRYGNQPTPISRDSIAKDISREGTYYLMATDTLNQCNTQVQYQNVRAPSRLRSFNLFLFEPACDLNKAGNAIIDTINGASDMELLTYSLNDGPYIDRDTFPFLYANETYDISAKDQYGCTLDTVLIPELRGVMDRISRIQDTTINSGDSLNFNDPAFKINYTSPDAPLSEQYTWILNPDTLSCDYDCTEMIQKQLFHTRTVSAHLTNQYGCTIADTFRVHVREGDVLNIPNGIIPSGNNAVNAHACIYTNQYVASVELYVVFDRLGRVIFKRSEFNPQDPNQNLSNCWSGRDPQNNIYPPGSYNYYVRYKTVYGVTKQKYGNIFLVR